MLTLLQFILLIVQLGLGSLVGYLLFLTIMAFRAPQQTSGVTSEARHRFLFLIPAHNEAKLLPQLLENLHLLDYPTDMYRIHVVADNCTDETAVLGRAGGAIVHERFHDTQRGKGYALQWLLQRLWDSQEPHDAVIVIDADTQISSNFLRVMDARLARGEKVIQSYYTVLNADSSWGASIRAMALIVLHYLRPQGRMVLGASAGLKGNGMMFAADILKEHPWSSSVTEDIEQHMALLLAGQRVTFAPDAVTSAEMPDSLDDAESQNERWEQGRLQMARSYVPQLIKVAAGPKPKLKRFVYLDAVMEHVIPPFSILVGLTALTTGVSFLLQTVITALRLPVDPLGRFLALINVGLGVWMILGQIIYLLAGLRLVNAPAKMYRTLLYSPGYIIWKIWHYIKLLMGPQQDQWIRTTRNAE